MSYTPNKIPLASRVISIVFSIFLFAYGSYSLAINKLTIPFFNKFGGGGIVYLHDGSAIMMYISFILYILTMIAHVVDHYDERDNEYQYFVFKFIMTYLSMLFFIGAFIYGLVFQKSQLSGLPY